VTVPADDTGGKQAGSTHFRVTPNVAGPQNIPGRDNSFLAAAGACPLDFHPGTGRFMTVTIRPAAIGAALFWFAAFILVSAGDAFAIVKGTSSSLERHTLRIVRGGIRCSGVAVARNLVITAGHCGARGTVIGGGAHIAIAGASRSATLDDGRRIGVSGDAIIARLARPLPAAITPFTVGEGGGESYTIAGYGTADERHRGAFGYLREARLIAAERFALVDPNRDGSISASACFGDSGGPVLRGSQLVGIITRAAHPHPRIACGHLTRWAPVTVSGEAAATGGNAMTPDQVSPAAIAEAPRKTLKRQKHAKRTPPQWPWFWRTVSTRR